MGWLSKDYFCSEKQDIVCCIQVSILLCNGEGPVFQTVIAFGPLPTKSCSLCRLFMSNRLHLLK